MRALVVLRSGAIPFPISLMAKDLHAQLAAAIAAERAAWHQVKDKLPGTPAYDDAAWQAWRAAVQRCRDLRKAIDEASAPAGQRPRPQRNSGKHA